jgi:hypothetical protein
MTNSISRVIIYSPCIHMYSALPGSGSVYLKCRGLLKSVFFYNGMCRSQGSKVDVVTRLHTRQTRTHDLTPAGVRYSLFFSKVFRLPLGPTKPYPVVTEDSFPEGEVAGVWD